MKLPKTAVPIKDAIDHWVDVDGSIYAIDHRNHHNKLIKKAFTIVHGYCYVGIRYHGKTQNTSKRVHRLVAEAFIPNPNNNPVVGHRNNIKSDNRVENLYWTTIKENTKKAFDDGLAKNDKGKDDSQSMPVVMYDTLTNKKLNSFGSIKEASKETGIVESTIARQAKYKRPVRKPYYFRYIDDESVLAPQIIGMYDYKSDRLLDSFIDIGDAASQTGTNVGKVYYQVKNGKPRHKFSDVYFKLISSN